MTRLIISCDDLGITKEINLAIKDCAEEGVISSSSIVANGEFYEHVLTDVINKIPLSFFGLHLNLTEGNNRVGTLLAIRPCGRQTITKTIAMPKNSIRYSENSRRNSGKRTIAEAAKTTPT